MVRYLNMSGEYGNWWAVGFSILLFLYFIKSAFKPRTKVDWASYHYMEAFVVALFAEMYGFPLTIYLLTTYFGNKLNLDFTHNGGHLLNTLLGTEGDPHFSGLHIVSGVLIVVGLSLLNRGWKTLYKATRKGVLAREGVYQYVRHPQYMGFVLLIVGFLLEWPTLITVLMAPILIWRYTRLSLDEEREMEEKFGQEYRKYTATTPRYLPKLPSL